MCFVVEGRGCNISCIPIGWDFEESHKIAVKILLDMSHMGAIRAERS